MITEDPGQPHGDSVPRDDREVVPVDPYDTYRRRLKRLLIISGVLIVAGLALSLLQTHLVGPRPAAILHLRPPGGYFVVSVAAPSSAFGGDTARYAQSFGSKTIDGVSYEWIELSLAGEDESTSPEPAATILAHPFLKAGHRSGAAAELRISSSILLRLEPHDGAPPCVVRNLQDDRLLTLPAMLAHGEHRLWIEWPSVAASSPAASDTSSADSAGTRPAISTSQESQR